MVLVRNILALTVLSLLAQAVPSPTLKPDVALPQSHVLVDSAAESTALHQFQKRQTCYTFFFFWRWCFADDDDRDVVTTTFAGGQKATVTLRTVTTTTSSAISTTAVSTARTSTQSSAAQSSSRATTSVAASTSQPATSTAVSTSTSGSTSRSSIAVSSVGTASTSRVTSTVSTSSLAVSSSSVAASSAGSSVNTASTSSGAASSSVSSVNTASTSSVAASSAVSSVNTASTIPVSSTTLAASSSIVPSSAASSSSSSIISSSSATSGTTIATSLSSSSTPVSLPVTGSLSSTTLGSSAESVTAPTSTSSLSSSVVTSTASATPTSKWASPTLPVGWRSVSEGIAEGTTGRALTGSTYSSTAMTVELCIAYCNVNGFSIAAVEYGGECYCGNEFSNGADPSITSPACDMPCSGNNEQLCGGASCLTVYRNELYVAPQLSLPAGWAPADPLCISEVPGRALTGSFYAADNMTVDMCVAYCSGMGFPFAGVEYGRECMCGTALVNGASFDKPSNACSMQCAGSSASNRQICGGSNALSVYYQQDFVSKTVLPKGWESLGCIAEGNQGRALISAQMDSDSMTIDMCLNYCSSKGYGMAGLEYGRQCFCAKDSLSNGASLAVTSNQCYTPCAGNILTPCGGNYALDLYWNPSVATAVKEIASAVGTWKDSGLCLQEVEGRALRGAAVRSAGMTIEYCLNYCGGLGFLMAGVEYGTECYCSQALEGGASVTRQSGQCNMYCSGNSEQTCGGPNAINYYTTSTLDVTVKLPAGWSKIGCVAEPQGHRALNVSAQSVSLIQGSFMTGVACANACAGAGYALAGVQYFVECRCSNALDVTALNVVDEKNCNSPCSGNEREMCGGAYHNTLYSSLLPVPLVG